MCWKRDEWESKGEKISFYTGMILELLLAMIATGFWLYVLAAFIYVKFIQ